MINSGVVDKSYPEVRKRWHNKTTSGCATCRKRRVKCDEQKPRCKGCTRNNLTCHGEDYGVPQLNDSDMTVIQHSNGHMAQVDGRLGRFDSEMFSEMPSPFAWKGSSDPFSALSIELTPYTMGILTCYMTAFLPAIWMPTWLRESPDARYPSEALVKSQKLAGSRSMARSVDFTFRHPESLPSWFFVALTCMRGVFEPLDPTGFQTLLLQYRTYSLRTLRESISEIPAESPPPVTVILQILRIFGAECMINEYLAAKAHAVVIPWIEKVQLEPRVFSGLMGAMMFNDTEIACKLFRNTAMDYENWLPVKLRSFWISGESVVPPIPHELEKSLHGQIAQLKGDSIERALRRLRFSLYLRDTLGPLGLSLDENSDLMCAWIQSRSIHDIGLLINQAVDLITGTRLPSKQDPGVSINILHSTDLYTALTLTTLYNIRKYLHDGSVDGHDIREAPLIIPALKSSLIRFLAHDPMREDPTINELLFWMYFTGVWHGKKQPCNLQGATCKLYGCTTSDKQLRDWDLEDKCPRHNSTTIWFDIHLAKQARILNLHHWIPACQLLTQFAFSNIMRPHPSMWYGETMALQWDPSDASISRTAITPLGQPVVKAYG